MNQKNANDDGSQREPLLSIDTEWQRNARMTREDTWRLKEILMGNHPPTKDY